MAMSLSARLDRTDTSTPWGFRLHGGKDFGVPLTIQRVTPGSLAAKCGVQVGDVIAKIGAIPTDHIKHKEAQGMIISAGNHLELNLTRNSYGRPAGGAPAPFEAAYQSCPPGPAPAAAGYGAPGVTPYQQNYNRPAQPFSPAGSGSQYSTPGGSAGPGAVQSPVQTPVQTPPVTSPVPPSGGSSSGAPTSPIQHVAPMAPPPAAAPPVKAPGGGGGGVWQPPMPSGPRTMKFGKIGEAKQMTFSGGMKVPLCHSCNVSIRGPFVSALNKTWCPNHFNCSNPQCGCPLISIGFVEEAGQLYCENDFRKFLAPRCGQCSDPIVEECVNALNNTFHPHCFLCAHCRQPIGSGNFHREDGQNYCEKDWQMLYQTKCYGCDFPIEPGDRWVEALNENWHSECFNCSTCQMNLEGQAFFAKSGKPYCQKHAASNKRF